MRFRHVVVAALVPAVLALAGPAFAGGSYPPGPPANATTVARGVVYGGPATGAVTISVCKGAPSAHTVRLGQIFLIQVCGFVPGSTVKMYVDPPRDKNTLVGRLLADGNGAVVGGPFRLTDPGRYRFTFVGTSGNVQGLGVGGRGVRGMSRVLADPNMTLPVTIDVPASGNLAHTGGDGGGSSAALWGAGCVLLGGLLVLLYVRRRRSSPEEAAVTL